MSDWDDHAAAWDTRPGVREYAEAALASLVAHAYDVGFDLNGLVVCDFGCGTGLLTERLTGLATRIDAIDSSAAMLDVLVGKTLRSGWTHVRPLPCLPDEAQGYDLVVCSSVLAFVDDVESTTRRLVAHLRPGGWFVQWDWEQDPAGGDAAIGYTQDGMRSTLADAGLQQVDVRPAFEIEVDGHVMRPLMGTGRRPA